jgi:hypothetical protein
MMKFCNQQIYRRPIIRHDAVLGPVEWLLSGVLDEGAMRAVFQESQWFGKASVSA